MAYELAFDALLSQEESKHTFSLGYRFGNHSGNLLRGQHPPTTLHSFYAKVYAASTTDVREREAFWDNVVLPQMSSAQADSRSKPISVEEVQQAIKVLGPDGLTNEFYKILGPKLEETLPVLNSFLEGE